MMEGIFLRNDYRNIEELEKRVDELRKEAQELKQIILSIKSADSAKVDRVSAPNEALKEVKPIKNIDKGPVDWENLIGQVWLPRIFIFVLLIGVIWAFKAASNYGFLNENVKIAAGYIASAVLIFLGFWQTKKNRIALGHVLLGGSIVLLLIDTFAMHVLYGMIPTIPAFILNLIWVGLGLYFSHHFSSQPLAILTGVGGYLIPFLLESAHPSILNFTVFETTFYLILLIYAMIKKYQFLYPVAFVFLHLSFIAATMFTNQSDLKMYAIAALLQHIFLVLTFFFNRSFFKVQIGISFTSFVFLTAWLKSAYPSNQFEIMILGIFAVYSFVSVWFWKKDRDHLSVTLSISSFALMVFLVNHFEFENGTGLLMAEGLITLYLGIISKSKLGQAVGGFVYAVGAFITLLEPFKDILSIYFVNWTVLIASLFAFLPLVKIVKPDELPTMKKIIQAVAMVLILVYLTYFANAITTDQTMNIQHMAVSFIWAIYAFVAIVIGSKWDEKLIRISGLGLLFLTLVKLIFIDLDYLSIIVRAILFIVLGLIGIVISRMYYNSQPGKK
jgi:uncharacterized membrane protein